MLLRREPEVPRKNLKTSCPRYPKPGSHCTLSHAPVAPSCAPIPRSQRTKKYYLKDGANPLRQINKPSVQLHPLRHITETLGLCHRATTPDAKASDDAMFPGNHRSQQGAAHAVCTAAAASAWSLSLGKGRATARHPAPFHPEGRGQTFPLIAPSPTPKLYSAPGRTNSL